MLNLLATENLCFENKKTRYLKKNNDCELKVINEGVFNVKEN